MPAKKQQASKQPQQQEPSISREPSVASSRAPSVQQQDQKPTSKSLLPTPVLASLLAIAWFLPLFQSYSIWNLFIGSKDLNDKSCLFSSNPSQITMVKIAIVSLFCSSMSASLGNRMLTAFLTLVGTLMMFSVSFLQITMTMSFGEVFATKAGLTNFFLSGEYFGFGLLIFVVVHLVLQFEMKTTKH